MGKSPNYREASSTVAMPSICDFGQTHWLFVCPYCGNRQDSIDIDEEDEVDCHECSALYFPQYPA